MRLSVADYAIVAAFFAVNLSIGLYYARRGGKSLSEYFLSGRNVPWWLAGISMVATTFAVDTPLAVSGFVTQHGIAGNWLWWSSVMSGILTVFFFAKLWRRSGVLTDVEFIETRYGGQAAAALRLVRAIFQGVLVNTIVMGWVNLAMMKILVLVLGLHGDGPAMHLGPLAFHISPKVEALAICLSFTGIYAAIGGLWGVLVTDLLQFVVKMTMAIVLAIVAVAAVGGIGALEAKLAVVDAARGGGSILAFFPTGGAAWMPLYAFAMYIGVQWWASSYPGAEPGGGGYIAQRIFSARSENDSLWSTLFFNVTHYALRPWPWILVALAAIVLYPHGVAGADGRIDPELGYVRAMIDYLPGWLRGLMLAGFLAAYMSTIGTQLNLGASYLTNDVYRRFMVRSATERHYVAVSRIATLLAMVLAFVAAFLMTSVGDAWIYLFNLTAGVGLVVILRWYWWRVNAWSEIAALVASAVVSNALLIHAGASASDPNVKATILLVTVAVTTLAWLVVTFVTPPESPQTLDAFYRKVRPSAFGWRPVARRIGGALPAEPLGLGLLEWVAGCGLVYGALFGIGKIVLGDPIPGYAYLALAALCLAFIVYGQLKRSPTDQPAPPAGPTSTGPG